ncbi:TPA: iron-sulfur cluster insertion protein ErpA [Candidatus Woesearchaeota archaeon]|nr:iron-sulfur cluster insertion protein ErpA [Candidatus Woesearchaeota archaeon]
MAKQKTEVKQVVTITEKAAGKIMELAKQDNKEKHGLKLYVFPGGCSGFQYGMDFEENPEKTDLVMEQHGVKIFVDKDSVEFLKGVKIDFVDSLHGSGFKIDNPNATSTCGCGKSVC